jgi:GNAT superfamily N-acetyltransferase
MEIAPLDPADETTMAELFALHQEVHAADSPDHPAPQWESFRAQLGQQDAEVRVEAMVARRADRVVGGALIGLPTIDNAHLALFELSVHPAHRRKGVGRALLDRVERRAREEGRRTLIGSAIRPVPGGPPRPDAGTPFLSAMGFVPALESRRRRIDLAAIESTAEAELLAGCLARAEAYECLAWTGQTPAELADGVARLSNRVLIDSPTGDLDIEQSTMDGDRLRADEQRGLDRGNHLVGAAARHRETGEVAAITGISIRPAADHGEVWLTIADPRHRGHRLGTIVKIECHRLARRRFPLLRHVTTANADENAQMAAINEKLGFEVYETSVSYQRELPPA